MELWGETLTFATGFFLLLALALALSFEFVNGFHDTANAVATVIYTNTLKPVYAVVWSGCWNLIGVLWSTGAVAYSIVALLPVELVLHSGSGAGFAMIFALLVSAIIWNVGTWYLGLPVEFPYLDRRDHGRRGGQFAHERQWLDGRHQLGAGL
jgi:PiT family inorganic phosphate transporter